MQYIKLMILSTTPVIELRGAIPIGIAWNLNPIILYAVCVLGSTIIAIPIILIFRNILNLLKSKSHFDGITKFIEKKISSRAKKMKSLSIMGIIVFVGIPLPTTGTWSAAAIASVLRMRISDAIIGIFLGNIISGIIVSLISLHII